MKLIRTNQDMEALTIASHKRRQLLRDLQRLVQGRDAHAPFRGRCSGLILELGEGWCQHTLQEYELGDGVARPGGVTGVEEGQLVLAT